MKKIMLSVVCILLCLLCRYSINCAQAVRTALELCINSAIPALFPFFVVSSLAISCGLAQVLGSYAAPLMRNVFHLPSCGAAALMLGFLGGYPSGARAAAELWREGQCSRSEAEALAACCNNTGPAFLIGMCGGGLFHSMRIGIFLYCIHILSALLTAFLLRPKQLSGNDKGFADAPLPPFFSAFTQAVLSAGRSCLIVSAFILCFSVMLCLMQCISIGDILPKAFHTFLSVFGLSSVGMRGLLTGFFELTQGLLLFQPCAGSLASRLTAVSALCAFGGLSVLCQTAAVLDGLSVRKCLYAKCIHTVCAAILCRMLLFLPCCTAFLL